MKTELQEKTTQVIECKEVTDVEIMQEFLMLATNNLSGVRRWEITSQDARKALDLFRILLKHGR